jgi:hypothetical protein
MNQGQELISEALIRECFRSGDVTDGVLELKCSILSDVSELLML